MYVANPKLRKDVVGVGVQSLSILLNGAVEVIHVV
jgi:hypothetical protein